MFSKLYWSIAVDTLKVDIRSQPVLTAAARPGWYQAG